MATQLTGKARKTLEAMFRHPLPRRLTWREIEALIRALGGRVDQRSGSRVAFTLPNGQRKVFRSPHTGKGATSIGRVTDVRDWLRANGIEP